MDIPLTLPLLPRAAIFGIVLLLSAIPARSSQIYLEAGNTSGFSFFADPGAANGIPEIAANTSLKLAVANGDDLFSGAMVLIGTFFGISDVELKNHATDIHYLQQNFTPYGAMHIGDGDTPAGSISGSVTANSGALAGQQIYLMLVAGTNNASPSTSFATAFQVGVYFFDKSINPAWAFPSDSPVPEATTIDLSDLTIGNAGTTLNSTGAHVVIGSFGPDKSNSDPTSTNFVLAAVPVPEPMSLHLLGMAGLGALAFRRKRRLRPVR